MNKFALIIIVLFLMTPLPLVYGQEDQGSELVTNGGFELGSLDGWTLVHGTTSWYNEMPHGSTPAGEVPFEGSWRLYTNPNDHDSPAIAQNVVISTAEFTLKWGILPHSGSHPRLIALTAFDEWDQPLIDTSGNKVELIYSMVGDYGENEGYKIYLPLSTRNPNTGISAWEYYIRDFEADYISAGGNPVDFQNAAYIRLMIQAYGGSGGTDWDALSITFDEATGETEMPHETETEPEQEQPSEPEQETPTEAEPQDNREKIAITTGEEFTIQYQQSAQVGVFTNYVDVAADVTITVPSEVKDKEESTLSLEVDFGSSTILAKMTGFLDQTGYFYPSFSTGKSRTQYALFQQQIYYYETTPATILVSIDDPMGILEQTKFTLSDNSPLEITLNPALDIEEQTEVTLVFDISYESDINMKATSSGFILYESTLSHFEAPKLYEITVTISPNIEPADQATKTESSSSIPAYPIMSILLAIILIRYLRVNKIINPYP